MSSFLYRIVLLHMNSGFGKGIIQHESSITCDIVEDQLCIKTECCVSNDSHLKNSTITFRLDLNVVS
jgi:hypothetical protein